jgi:hypothetical protein
MGKDPVGPAGPVGSLELNGTKKNRLTLRMTR